MDARSPVSAVFLLHIALEIPIAIQGIWAPHQLPFIDMTNTTLLYAALSLSACLAALLVYPLPEFLPGKRALALTFLVYHSILSTVLIQSPRFIPHSFGSYAENWNFTPEILWASLHGFLSIGFVAWWQTTLKYAKSAKNYKMN
ncbi:hypothetical protein BOTBODRAFT_175714 [Botryobasidium botryosum FD-172 SS1]|uniref:EXPERA domain-containing protein n=1 Tax=Botryobasidium botryosum (strain FD-172 SS1) TaxID=930990 RepID=A0A067MPB0_BOTB1|nr:hypothetical protein BOTBODRAFT_175714 [Botryobasidium botryosum FD-172 SS1]